MQFYLKIVSPDKLFYEGKVDEIITKGVCGEFAVLPNMASFVTQLAIDKIRIQSDGKEKFAVIGGGYIDVRNNKVTVVANAIEWPEEIDKNRALRAKERALKRLESNEGDSLRAEIALKKAINRLSVTK
ncbi:MAG: ATP synthase F1 subunit epsilon [Ezakiella sp.]|nr:ATP synthase F1 subunit epsilon [Ezakiella sp.]MDD7471860.1 ATP synthase F1 subunit epsilon [Bacillota bacterium]MDY3923824.1 ATP synthase F1 subunit epsilon [Ezakiella sp.]